jgi:Icc-related predicted phosphoesterase
MNPLQGLTPPPRIDSSSCFDAFLGTLPHRHKVVIAGNHDFAFEKRPAEARALLTHCIYLQDSEATVEGVRIWGSPWQPWFYDWAFNLKRGPQIRAKWDLIPEGIGILVTHGPPLGHGDEVPRAFGSEKVGCADLLEAVRRVKPRYHVFGHIHEGYGITKEGPTTFVNASLCDAAYRPVNPPLVLDW